MTMGQLNLKSYDFMSLLDAAFSMYRRNFSLFFWICAVFFVLPLLATQIISIRLVGASDMFTRIGDYVASLSPDSFDPDPEMWTNLRQLALYLIPINGLLFILTPLSYGPLINAIHRNAIGSGCGFKEAFRIGARKYVNLFLGFLLFNLIVGAVLFPVVFVLGISIGIMANPACFGGMMCLLIPIMLAMIIYVSVLFSLYAQGIVVENRGPLDALSRSARLIRGSWWRAFGILIVVQLLIGLIYQFSEFGFGSLNKLLLFIDNDLEIIGKASIATGLTVVQIFTNPILMLGQTILFYDLKVRREAFDLEVMIRGFDADV
jgi:hypothetical protein